MPDLRIRAGAEAARTWSPMWIFTSASLMSRRLGVGVDTDELDAGEAASTMRLTAFVPPPPTPTTLMTAT